jgi:hypothetical protein
MTMASVLVVGGLLAPLSTRSGEVHSSPVLPAEAVAAAHDIELASAVASASLPQPGRAETPAAPNAQGPLESAEPTARSGAVDGGLVVESRPAGARVTVNGIGFGDTPLRIPYLPFGTKRVRIIKEGYASVERTVRVDAGTPRPRVRVTLRELQ